jgi:hypothetical protein
MPFKDPIAMKNYLRRYLPGWRARRKKSGLCFGCSQPAVVFPDGLKQGKMSRFCAEHLKDNRRRSREYGQRLRDLVSNDN